MKKSILFIFIIFSLTSVALDYKDFGKLPFFSNVTLSPDGEKIAALANIEGKPYIVVTEFGSTNFNPIASLKNEYDRLEWIEWANNKKIIFQTSKAEKARERTFRVYDLNTIDSDGSNFKIIENKSIYKDKQNSYISKYESIYLVDILKYEENIETCIPNTLDISATLLPTLPKPTIPIFLPLISFPFNFFFSQRPL